MKISRHLGTLAAALSVSVLTPGLSSAQQVDSLEHDATRGVSNSIVQVDADTYLLAYAQNSNDGYLATFTIQNDGTMITEVQSLDVHDGQASFNSLIHLDGTTYVLAYRNGSGQGVIKTFTVPADGSSITEVQSLIHDTSSGFDNSLVRLDANTCVLAYMANAVSSGFIKTFSISAGGATISQVQSLEHETAADAHENSLVQVDADTYALAYAGVDLHGYIKTFTITAGGATITQVQSFEHDTVNGRDNSLIKVDADTYALAYTGASLDGFIKTFTIPANGSTISEVDSLEHETGSAQANSLVQVDADTYALAYTGSGQDGFIATFTIPADGSTITEVDSLEHDTERGLDSSLAQVDADTYVLAYGGFEDDGFIKTFTISAGGFLPVTLLSFGID